MLFVTYTTNTYWTIQVSNSLADNPTGPFEYQPYANISNATDPDFVAEVQRMRTLLSEGALEVMQPAQCIDAYNVRYQTTYGSVLLVSDDSTPIVHDNCHYECSQNRTCPVPVRSCGPAYDSGWMCDSDEGQWGEISECLVRAPQLRNNASSWKPSYRTNSSNQLNGEIPTNYCLAEKKEGLCFVQGSPTIAIVVLVMTLAKAIAMILVVRCITADSFVTIGDAISSFLAMPDPYTRSMCLASYADFRKMRDHWDHTPKMYNPTRACCFNVTGRVRWIACVTWYVSPASRLTQSYDPSGIFWL